MIDLVVTLHPGGHSDSGRLSLPVLVASAV